MIQIFILIQLVIITLVHAASEQIDHLPEPTGPYPIGLAKTKLTDPYRKEIEHPEGRHIPIQIYFPMEDGEHALHTKIFEEKAPDQYPPLQVQVYSQKADLSSLAEGKHPVILLNHGSFVSMTDYGFIAEDLASHGYIVVSVQHQLRTDPQEPAFWKERSILRHATVIDNLLYVFEWLKDNQKSLFDEKIDLKRVGLIGHSMGGNSLLLFANRASSVFKKKSQDTLLPRQDPEGVRECLIVLDTGGFPYPIRSPCPLFFLFSEEREAYQRESGTYEELIRLGYQVRYYKGSKHISFMDHGYVNPPHPNNPSETYFRGSLEERKAFFDEMRKDIRDFLRENLQKTK